MSTRKYKENEIYDLSISSTLFYDQQEFKRRNFIKSSLLKLNDHVLVSSETLSRHIYYFEFWVFCKGLDCEPTHIVEIMMHSQSACKINKIRSTVIFSKSEDPTHKFLEIDPYIAVLTHSVLES